MKYLFLLLLMFFLSGCTVQYDLTIDEQGNFLEKTIFQAENLDESVAIQDNSWPIKVDYNDPDVGENPEKIEGVDYYDDTVLIHDGYYRRQLTYQHTINTLKNSNVIQSCFEHFYVNENASSITLSTSSEFLCMNEFSNLNLVQVRIHLPHKVLSSNADVMDGNQYLWNITRDNYQEKGFILNFEKSNLPSNSGDVQEEEEESVSITVVLIILFFFVLFLVGVFVYNYKQRNHS